MLKIGAVWWLHTIEATVPKRLPSAFPCAWALLECSRSFFRLALIHRRLTENLNTDIALAYHEATKHSWASIRANPHRLDWVNRPSPFKIYPALEGRLGRA